MFCTKCGTKNNGNASFCVNCGEKFNVVSPKKKTNENYFISYFKNLFSFVTKPVSFLKGKNKLDDTGKAFTYAGISLGMMWIANIIMKLIYAGIYSAKLSSKFFKVNFLKYLSFPKIILLDLVIFAAIIFGLAGIITLAGVITKKKVKYTKMLSLVSMAIIPYAIGAIILYTLFSTFSLVLAFIFGVLGLMYTIILIISVINNELDLDGDKKIYVNAIIFCVLAIIATIAFYLFAYKGVNITFKSVTKFSESLNLFK